MSCSKLPKCTLTGLRVEIPHHAGVSWFPRIGTSSYLHHDSGDGEEPHTSWEAAVLVRRPVLLQRPSLGPAEHQGPRGPGDG